MAGKRDGIDESIAAFLNRYRAEVLGHPVAFEEVGRPKRYTFVDDVAGIRPDVSIEDLTVSVESTVERLYERHERDAFDRLYDAADRTVSAVDERVGTDHLDDALHLLRREGYANEPYTKVSNGPPDPTASGTAFFVGKTIEDDVRAAFEEMSRVVGGGECTGAGALQFRGFPVKPSAYAPDRKGVVVDVDALAPPTPGAAHVTPFVVRDPRGIVAIERVDTDFEWASGGR